jgi:hypothetical protein
MEIKNWLIENFFTLVTTIFGSTSFLGYILERKKRLIQEKQDTTDALKSMQEAYNKFSEDMFKKYEEQTVEIKKLHDKIDILTLELQQERDLYNKLKK